MTTIRDREFESFAAWRTADDRVEVSGFPSAVRIVEDVSVFDARFLRRVGDLILITASNGNATYRIAVEDKIRGELDCVLEDSEFREPTSKGPF